MVSINISLADNVFAKLARFPWVNWSEVSREESLKKRIFEKFIKTGELSKKEEEFCEEIDWCPVDEMELKEEYIEELKRIEKGPHSKPMTAEEFDKWMDEL